MCARVCVCVSYIFNINKACKKTPVTYTIYTSSTSDKIFNGKGKFSRERRHVRSLQEDGRLDYIDCAKIEALGGHFWRSCGLNKMSFATQGET